MAAVGQQLTQLSLELPCSLFAPSGEPNAACQPHRARRYTPGTSPKSGSTHPRRAATENSRSAEEKRKRQSRLPSASSPSFSR